METRILIAYLLIGIIFLGISGGLLYATRDIRSVRRAQKQSARTRREAHARQLAEQKG